MCPPCGVGWTDRWPLAGPAEQRSHFWSGTCSTPPPPSLLDMLLLSACQACCCARQEGVEVLPAATTPPPLLLRRMGCQHGRHGPVQVEDLLEYYLQRATTTQSEAERLLAGSRDLEESIGVSLSARRFEVCWWLATPASNSLTAATTIILQQFCAPTSPAAARQQLQHSIALEPSQQAQAHQSVLGPTRRNALRLLHLWFCSLTLPGPNISLTAA